MFIEGFFDSVPDVKLGYVIVGNNWQKKIALGLSVFNFTDKIINWFLLVCKRLFRSVGYWAKNGGRTIQNRVNLIFGVLWASIVDKCMPTFDER